MSGKFFISATVDSTYSYVRYTVRTTSFRIVVVEG